MARRAVRFLLGLLILILVLAAAAYAYRVPLAQTVLLRHLERIGVPGARLTVAEVEADGVALSDISAGEAGEISVKSVRVRYNLAGLLERRAEGIEIEGLSLNLDLGEGAAPFGSLQSLIDGFEPEPDRAPLPEVRLIDARVQATTPLGPAVLALDGALREEDSGSLVLDLDIGVDSRLGIVSSRLKARGGGGAGLAGTLTLTGEGLVAPQGDFRAARVEGDIAFAVEKGGWPARGTAELLFEGLSLARTDFDAAELRLDLSDRRAEVAGLLRADDGSFRMALDGKVEDLRGRPRVALELTAEITAAAPLQTLAAGRWPEAGRGRLDAVMDGELPSVEAPPQSLEQLLAWLLGGAFQGEIHAELTDLDFGAAGLELSASARVAATWSDRELTLELTEDGEFAAGRITPDLLGALGLPEALADWLATLSGGSLSVRLPTEAPHSFRVRYEQGDERRTASLEGMANLRAGPFAASLSGRWIGGLSDTVDTDRVVIDDFELSGRDFALNGYEVEEVAIEGGFEGRSEDFQAGAEVRVRLRRPAVGEASAERAELVLPVRVTRRGKTAAVALTRPGSLVVEGLRLADRLSAPTPVRVTIREHDATLRLNVGGGAPFAFDHRTVLGLDETDLAVPREGGEPLGLRVRAPRVVVTGTGDAAGDYQGRAEIADAGLVLPDYALALEGLSADIALTPGMEGASARFDLTALSQEGTPPAFAPLRLSGQVRHRAGRLEVSAQARGPSDQALAKVSVHHDLAQGTGGLEAELEPLSFAPGGLQPGQLSPLLAGLQEASGRVNGAAHVEWDGEGLSGTAELVIDGLSFKMPEARVEGLDLRLRLDQVAPPSSPPGQSLTVASIDPGLPIDDIAATFRLPPGPLGRVLVERAGFALGTTRFSLGETLVDASARRNELELKVGELDLKVLLEAVAIDGLSGQGRLGGTIPVVVNGDTVAIENAQFSSLAPGLLIFRSEAATRALAYQGTQVELMLRALENFHYDSMDVTANMDNAYQAELRIGMLGRNPDLMGGHPFQFNINLSANLGPFLETLRLGREVAADLLRRSWRLGP